VTTAANYYEVLAVARGASADEIRAAYRRAARRHHPDRGGTHADMVRANEAWKVLSDPVRRAAYDAVLTAPADGDARRAWEDASAGVKRSAADYPRSWADFSRHLDAVVGDVVRARYATTPYLAGLCLPNVTGSASASLLTAAGATVGMILAWNRLYFPQAFLSGLSPVPRLLATLAPAALGLWAGAWAGALAHRGVRHAALRRRNGHAAVIPCVRCGQRLRVPRHGRTLSVRCPRCRARFDHAPAGAAVAASSGPVDRATAPADRRTAAGNADLRFALIYGACLVIGAYAAWRLFAYALPDAAAWVRANAGDLVRFGRLFVR
jgi:hypothetical protein